MDLLNKLHAIPLIKAQQLTVHFLKNTPVLQNVSLDIYPGERVAIIGPNGSGKTTLLRALSGRFPRQNSKISLKDQPLSRQSRQDIARIIAYVAQNDYADSRLLVQDYVALGQAPYARINSYQRQQQLIRQALENTAITSLSMRSLGTLSGGQMQRVLLARALAQTPQILMLDEPTNHLDQRARHDLLTMVRHCPAQAVIAVLHDLSMVPMFADKVMVLQKGQLVACGTVAETLTEPVLNEVFGMTHFIVAHPEHHRPVWVFEPLLS